MTVMRPMLATPGRHIPAGDGWTHEVKWDGIRVLADSRDGLDRFLSRNGNDVTRAWPDLAVSPFPGRDLLVDGEVIALNEEGLPDFRVLQERMHVRSASAVARLVKRVPATFMVFDLLRLDGTELTSEPLERRRELLVDLMAGAPWQVPTAYADGPMLYEATRQQGLEGIVSKRLSSRYVFGERTPNWLKFAHRHRGSYVVGGWRPQEGGTHLAALLVGEPTANGLLYRGRVGSGIGPKVSRQLTAALEGLGRTTSPFAQEVPRVDALGTHWVDPVLVVDVEAHRLPRAEVDRLRQPAYKGIRPDLNADDL
jgi:bifunctional non-homologous end joining protein LigD